MELHLYQRVKSFCLTSSYFTNIFLQVMENEIKREEMQVEKRSIDYKEINDHDHERQVDFEGEDEEVISREG